MDHSSLEPLESRRLLSAVVRHGILEITGTHKDNTITVELGAHSNDTITVTIDGVGKTFAQADVRGVSIQAGQGNDYVLVDNTDLRLSVGETIHGSGGKDTLIGGAGLDRIYGDAGNDSIRGANKRDILYGGSGDDSIDGGQGNDYINGESGNDTLIGNAGVDYIYGGAGSDTIGAADGNTDHVDGGSGTDSAAHDSVDDFLVSIEIEL